MRRRIRVRRRVVEPSSAPESAPVTADAPGVGPGSRTDFLLGRLAVREGFLTEAQLQRLLQKQKEASVPKLLGELMLENGFATPQNLHDLLKAQAQILEKPPGYSDLKQKDVVFGSLALKRGWVTEAQIKECLQIQGTRTRRGRGPRLGEILVARGFLTNNQVIELLDLQDKKILRCAGCGARYNVAKASHGASYACKQCGRALVVPPEISELGADDTVWV